MHCEMFFQITVLCKTFATFYTNKRLFSRVCTLMHVEGALLNEAFSTNRAAIRLLPSVGALVCVQVPLLCIAFSTQGASERFLPCVAPLVYFKLTKASKTLAALQAAEPLCSGVPQVVKLHVSEYT